MYRIEKGVFFLRARAWTARWYYAHEHKTQQDAQRALEYAQIYMGAEALKDARIVEVTE